MLHTVTYVRNDGSDEFAVYEGIEPGSDHTIPDEQMMLYRHGFIHIGWSLTPDGAGGRFEILDDYDNRLTVTMTVNEDLVLYAIWDRLH